MKCPNCGSDNPPNEPFCLGCGTDLASVQPAATPANGATAGDSGTTSPIEATTPVAAGPLVLALRFNGQEFPLLDGGTLVIARTDTDKCTPNIAIDSDRVSSAPVEVKAENGKATVSVDARGVTIRVTKLVKPGESIELQPGEMMMLGDQVITVG